MQDHVTFELKNFAHIEFQSRHAAAHFDIIFRMFLYKFDNVKKLNILRRDLLNFYEARV